MRAASLRGIVAAAVLGLLLAALPGCDRVTPATLGQLAADQQTYEGWRVRTEGVVREEQDRNGRAYFVLSDGMGHLVGLKPVGQVRRYTGERVKVSGLFQVEAGFGRVIRIEEIESSFSPTSSPEAQRR
ncbi:MAG TPA: hypothetical protein VFY39_01175 [Gammaproteobacteria bacterium]|nr:hypothetical protein [Gammaproteobacteria bacterium]